MKTKLLFLFSLVPFSGFAQSPIVSFTPNPDSSFMLLTTDTPPDQTAEGANATWSFTGLTEFGSSSYGLEVPTSEELLTFPGSTQKLVHFEQTDVPSQTDIYFKAPGNDVSITGISAEGLLIAYNTNNAHIGAYPLEYGYNNTDAVAGNYVYGDYDGTFSGNITTSVDAYGTFTTDLFPFEGPFAATRMKTQQTLSMNYSIFTNVGTFTQTIWDYFPEGSNDPTLRVTTTSVNIPLLSINETTTGLEMFLPTLATKSWNQQSVQVAPNPVENVMAIQTANHQKIKSVTIADATGKIVLDDHSQSQSIELGHLQQGVYFATIVTDAGISTKKIVKK